MGVQVWVERGTERQVLESVPISEPEPAELPTTPPPAADQSAVTVSTLDWEPLRLTVAACMLCGLHETRTQTVFGVGNPDADWVFIGEAPGAEEDKQGKPFVGRAGHLLDNMLGAMQLQREDVFIANILKCRPPQNRDPQPEESRACRAYLQRQIDLLKPKIVVVLGRIAAQNLLQTDTPIGKLRGREYVYEDTDIPLVVTYHPAYLLRKPSEKRKSWDDLRLAMRLMQS